MGIVRAALSAGVTYFKVRLIFIALALAFLILLHLAKNTGLLGEMLCTIPNEPELGFMVRNEGWIICKSPTKVQHAFIEIVLRSNALRDELDMRAREGAHFVFTLLMGYRIAKWMLTSVRLMEQPQQS